MIELRNFFRDNPAREVASEGLTAAAFDAEITALQAAGQERDAAETQLKKRLSGLQDELGRLHEPADNTLADFGFTNPIDGSMPEEVDGLTVTRGFPGTAIVQWEHSPRAANYRVSWKPQLSSGDATVAGLYVDGGAATLSGALIDVFVTARNHVGETQPTNATMLVPCSDGLSHRT